MAERFDLIIEVQPGGSILGIEKIPFRFVGGPFSFVYRELDGLVLARAKNKYQRCRPAQFTESLPSAAIGDTRAEGTLANKRVDELVQNEKYGEAVAQLLEDIEQSAAAAALAVG